MLRTRKKQDDFCGTHNTEMVGLSDMSYSVLHAFATMIESPEDADADAAAALKYGPIDTTNPYLCERAFTVAECAATGQDDENSCSIELPIVQCLKTQCAWEVQACMDQDGGGCLGLLDPYLAQHLAALSEMSTSLVSPPALENLVECMVANTCIAELPTSVPTVSPTEAPQVVDGSGAAQPSGNSGGGSNESGNTNTADAEVSKKMYWIPGVVAGCVLSAMVVMFLVSARKHGFLDKDETKGEAGMDDAHSIGILIGSMLSPKEPEPKELVPGGGSNNGGEKKRESDGWRGRFRNIRPSRGRPKGKCPPIPGNRRPPPADDFEDDPEWADKFMQSRVSRFEEQTKGGDPSPIRTEKPGGVLNNADIIDFLNGGGDGSDEDEKVDDDWPPEDVHIEHLPTKMAVKTQTSSHAVNSDPLQRILSDMKVLPSLPSSLPSFPFIPSIFPSFPSFHFPFLPAFLPS
jgi:hypothetical protein